ncbi:MAG: HAMP domain-containing sensor histidine kinase [Tissierellia bacterium]|nr:HAMP domain-containing sensor histidine kinase [Tissierellia bacterium]
MDQNELSNKVYELIVERDRLEKEIFIYIRSNQEILKERDTLLHEIKNPLTILSGDIEMLSTHYLPEDPKIHRLLERMSRSQKRIQDYIKNLAIHENIKTLTIDCKKVPIEAFVKFVQKELHHFQNEIVFKNAIYNPTQEIEIDLEIFLEGLLNIIKNSDTHATSMIFITIYEKESNLIVEVEDDGPGFSQNALKNYKQPYFSENPLVSNMGLGLYITDKIMEKLNIEMILSNQLGANTKLIIKKL